MKPIIRYTGSPDSNPDQWLRINHLTEQPGPGSAYRVTIEPLDSPIERMSCRRALIELLEAIEPNGRSAIQWAFDFDTAATNARKALGTEAPNA